MPLQYDYYEINIPSDAEEDKERRFDMAVMEARERARLYVMPCEWRLISDDGNTVKVCRVRNK